jgi:polyphosphate kinase
VADRSRKTLTPDTAAAPLPLFNRELSRLDYNRRVLAKAEQESIPLLERLRFLSFCSKNLDEFFMVRVGSARDMLDAGVSEPSADGMTPREQLEAIRARSRDLLTDMYRCLNEQIFPGLRNHGIALESFRNLSDAEKEEMRAYFRRHVAPILTPLAIDPGHPFPFVANLSLTIAATVESEAAGEHFVLVKLPDLLPSFIPLGDGRRFVPIGSLVTANLQDFFPSLRVGRAVLFRVIRNTELTLDDDEIRDLRDSVEAELRRRERKQVVCLEIDARADDDLVNRLAQGTRARLEDVYRVPGFLKINDLIELCDRVPEPSLKYEPYNPRLPQRLASTEDIFAIIRRGDVLVHRPYESFAAVVEFLHAAATDPSVVAIKQAVYQTDEHSPIVDKLALAALNGKQVTVVIELQARFEEKQNIAWAKRLQDAGAQVVYGLVGMQTHAKMALIVRHEPDGLRYYVHISTGNYNVDTARIYTDLDLLSANDEFGRDAAQLFNVLTGFSATSLTEALDEVSERPRWKHFVLSPFDYHRWLIEKIEREAGNAADGRPARITAKLNSVVDPMVIQALYRASAAGVKIDLIVRAMCSLVPGLPELSENIRVISIVDRFLEHSRLMRFENNGRPEIYLASGDWMPRNFLRRIEVTVPLLDQAIHASAGKLLDTSLADTASSWELQANGTWRPRPAEGAGVSSQWAFIQAAQSESARLDSYEETIEEPEKLRRKLLQPRAVAH